jgi:hypothetical protein
MADLGFLHSYFFMLKVPRIRPSENNKSCSILYNESNKIGLAIFWIFYDFLHILQVSANLQHYRRCTFVPGPYNFSKSHTDTPRLHKTPRKDLGACNATLGRGGGRGSGQFRRAGGTPRLASGQARLGAHLGRRGGHGLRGVSPTRTRGGGRRWRQGGRLAGQCATLGVQ